MPLSWLKAISAPQAFVGEIALVTVFPGLRGFGDLAFDASGRAGRYLSYARNLLAGGNRGAAFDI